jgi:hypothetical protein
MSIRLEYHSPVKRPAQRAIPVFAVLLGMWLLTFFTVPGSSAQSNGASASSSGHSSGGSASSVSSSGHSSSGQSWSGAGSSGHVSPEHISSDRGGHGSGNSGVTSSTGTSHTGNGSGHGHDNGHHPHRSSTGQIYYPYLYAVPVPYGSDVVDAGASDDDDPEYQGGPTVFDRRGSGADSYVPPVAESSSASQSSGQDVAAGDVGEANSNPAEAFDPTILIFKDGHQIEIANYAIVNQTLYDLTLGHPRKIALSDLNLPATEKENDDHGVAFKLPPSAQVN